MSERKPILKDLLLIEMGVIFDVYEGPRGFTQITADSLRDILREGKADESIAVD
jgi:hypothetical protein